MTVATQVEVLDLRHFSARQLRPLLEEEARVWEQRLRWDYRSSIELLLQYLDSRILPGFVALDRGRVCGYTFCVHEGHKAVVGDAFAVDSDPERAMQMTHTLLRHLLEMLRHSPDVGRIESQMLLHEASAIRAVFREEGFKAYPRLFMECELGGMEHGGGDGVLIGDLSLMPWMGVDYQASAELVHAAYSGHLDSEINDQYRTLHGSLRFLHNIVRFPGCGVFQPEQSWVLRERASGVLVGMVLCSKIAEDVAHITQLCVAKAYRGRGLGKMLLRHTAGKLAGARYQAITLTVTEGNAAAVALYESMGFSVRRRFEGMVLETGRNGLALR